MTPLPVAVARLGATLADLEDLDDRDAARAIVAGELLQRWQCSAVIIPDLYLDAALAAERRRRDPGRWPDGLVQP